MQWWDDLWLNEAFASWIETRIVDKAFPKWNYLVTRQETKARAVATDTLTSARRIRNPIETPADIGQAFDTITYNKGAAVIAMFEQYVGEESFRKGVNAYLRKHAWKNTKASDFLNELSLASQKKRDGGILNVLGTRGCHS